MMVIAYIAALWCAGYFVFQVVEVIRYGKAPSKGYVEFIWCGVFAPLAAFFVFELLYRFINI